MQRNSLHDFIWFGGSFQYIRDNSREGAVYYGAGYLEFNLSEYFEFLRRNNMRVSLNASGDLSRLKRRLDQKYVEGENNRLEKPDAADLNHAVNELRIVVFAESREVTAFFPNPKRYQVEALAEDVGLIFGHATFDNLPENAVLDFVEAGKCIVYETPTAAAYHLMRGSECILKHFYKCCIKRGRLEPSKMTWGAMVDHMAQKKKIDEALKGTFDIYRRGFRNPVAHPDKFYSIDEAQDLLGTATQLVALMVSHERYEPPRAD